MDLDVPIEKVSYTDIMPTTKQKQENTIINKPEEKSILPLIHNYPDSKNGTILHTSKAAIAFGSTEKEIIGDESFSFEKSKISQLKIDSALPVDVNDESIVKLKNAIMEKFKNILSSFEKMSILHRFIAVILLFFDILEMIGMFFMLLYLSLCMVPSEHILLWAGSGLFLCIMQMFLLIKGITTAASKESKTHKEYMIIAILFFLICGFFVVACSAVVIYKIEIFSDHLRIDAKNSLKFAQKILLISNSVKVLFQVFFVIIECVQLHNLNMMNTGENERIKTEAASQRPVLRDQNKL